MLQWLTTLLSPCLKLLHAIQDQMGDVATGPKKIDIRLLVRESWMQNYGFGLFLAFKSSNIDTQFTTYRLGFQSCAGPSGLQQQSMSHSPSQRLSYLYHLHFICFSWVFLDIFLQKGSSTRLPFSNSRPKLVALVELHSGNARSTL